MKTTKTTATPTPATEKKETPATFADYLTAFSTAYTNRDSDPANYEKTLFELAKLCTLSVLKKVIDPTRHNSNPTPATLLNPTPDGVKRYSYGDRETAVNSGFNPALVSVRCQLFGAVETLAKEANDFVEHDDFMNPATGLNLEDGFDFVNDAIVAILDETRRQLERDPGDPVDLTRPYETRRLKRKVYIQDPDSLGGYETVTTTPIQEVYKAIRRSIQDSRHVQLDPRNGYTYLEDLYSDPDGDSDPTIVYRRLPKYADLGGHAMDGDSDPTEKIDGQPSTRLTGCVSSYGDRETVDNIDTMVSNLNLTARQKQVLTYRFQGYGLKAIATRLGVSHQAIAKTLKQIAVKYSTVYGDPATETTTATETPTATATPATPTAPTRKKYVRIYRPIEYKLTPTPVITSPSDFGLIMKNHVVNGRLVGRDGVKTDSWLS